MKSLENSFTETAHAYHRYLHSRFGSIGLHRGQPRLMSRLWEEDGISQKVLAKRMNITAATLTRMVQSLEHGGFISRKKDALDQRVTRIFLTEKGENCREEMESIFKNIEESVFGDFTKKEMERFELILLKIRTKLYREMDDETDIQIS
ncbi:MULTISPECIES: MarR family winged helix-turn-helix transcriptional regulator [unclassified Oceanispirochaeta]|uniref:MarR family winged helix-turn-helix transcriptional regulator n=1 Tax=unclassified Oceanispirochaeta TaxID=2635722 RepID=UPI000E098717|nr:MULTISPECIES: MarR family transcriptional regulator [unclassified Oceanispirochaeta]MBF9017698.1 MarR family transcriptional regulator [Oceanispirochaeta sp. M2]NPD72101.1 MarR family transcriptional regulator [Oceanispirochaeta sp. M1]RDG32543.1 MarR family transcriptional regulator [Oceanispirochaeta sp. M1]